MTKGGPGGSAIRLKVKNLQVDGTITADGDKGASIGHSHWGAGGGGAGGSILLEIEETMTGSGIIRSIGGVGGTGDGGNNHGSSGGGGRVALLCKTNSFTGSWLTHGGKGHDFKRNMLDGGAGTTYFDCENDIKRLVLDNNNYQNHLSSLISDKNVANFALNILDVRGKAVIAFKPAGIADSAAVVVDLEEQKGDKTGTLNIILNTKFMSKGNVGSMFSNDYDTTVVRDGLTDAMETRTRRRYYSVSLQTNINVVVDESSEYVIPHTLYLEDVNLDVKGRLSGTRNVVVSKSSTLTLYDTGSTDHYTATRFPVQAVVNATSQGKRNSVFNCSVGSPDDVTYTYTNGAVGLGWTNEGRFQKGSGLKILPIETTAINPFKDYPSGEIIKADNGETYMGDIVLDFGFVGNRSIEFTNSAEFCVFTSNDGESWTRQDTSLRGSGNTWAEISKTIYNLQSTYVSRFIGMGGDSSWGEYGKGQKTIKVLTGPVETNTWEAHQGHYRFESIRVESGAKLVLNDKVDITSLNVTIGSGIDGETSKMIIKGSVDVHTTELHVSKYGHIDGDGFTKESKGDSHMIGTVYNKNNMGGAHAGEGGGYGNKDVDWRLPGTKGGYGNYEWPRTGGSRGGHPSPERHTTFPLTDGGHRCKGRFGTGKFYKIANGDCRSSCANEARCVAVDMSKELKNGKCYMYDAVGCASTEASFLYDVYRKFASGGAAFYVTATTALIDGNITMRGDNGEKQCPSCGGASGGSILISSTTISGAGMLDVSGGMGGNDKAYHSPNKRGGGGSGGRIAIHTINNHHTGLLKYHGGSPDPRAVIIEDLHLKTHSWNYMEDMPYGASGTYYTTALRGSKDGPKEVLTLDNHGIKLKSSMTLLLTGTNSRRVLPHLIMRNGASIRVRGGGAYHEKVSVILEVRKLEADRTGIIHVTDTSTLILHGDETRVTPVTVIRDRAVRADHALEITSTSLVFTGGTVEPAVDLQIDSKASFVTTPILSLRNINVEISGSLSGVKDLYVQQGTDLLFKTNAKTSQQNENYYKFRNLFIEKDSTFSLELDGENTNKSSFIDVEDKIIVSGTVTLGVVNITSKSFTVTVDGTVTADGRGYIGGFSPNFEGGSLPQSKKCVGKYIFVCVVFFF